MSSLSNANNQDQIVVSPNQVCQGMFVVLPNNWLDHPFLLNRFLINSEQQILKLHECGLKEIVVDLRKSKLPNGWSLNKPDRDQRVQDNKEPIDPRESGDLPDWNPENLIPQPLLEALHDTSIPAKKRSEAVYTHSREMMNRLLESPTAKNLKANKIVIGSIADLLLSDGLVASNMLHITSHDFYTYTHSVNVGVTSLMLARHCWATPMPTIWMRSPRAAFCMTWVRSISVQR